MNWEMIWQNLRYILLAVGGFAVGKGWVTNEQMLQLVGAIGVLGSAAWGLYVKYGTRAVPKAVSERADVPTVSAATGVITP